VILISNQKNLEDLVKILEKLSIISLDTEFAIYTEDEYFPRLSIIQIAYYENDIQKFAIIDILSKEITSFISLKAILSNKNIIKIIHSSLHDISVMSSCFGCKINGVFDTQIAYSMQKSQSTPIGYSTLSKELFNADIDKTYQYSKWLKRPIKNEMLEYAKIDVVYLHAAYEILQKEITENGNIQYFESDMKHLNEMLALKTRFSYKKIEIQEQNYSTIEKSRIYLLSNFRETLAIKMNLSLNILMPQDVLLNVIKLKYEDMIEEVSSYNIILIEILDFIKEEDWNFANQIFNHDFLSKNINKMHSVSTKINSIVDNVSMKYKISKFILASSNELKFLTKSIIASQDITRENLNILNFWRFELFGKKIIDLLNL